MVNLSCAAVKAFVASLLRPAWRSEGEAFVTQGWPRRASRVSVACVWFFVFVRTSLDLSLPVLFSVFLKKCTTRRSFRPSRSVYLWDGDDGVTHQFPSVNET